MDIEFVLLRYVKEPEQCEWIFFEKILRRNGQPFTVDDKAAKGPPPTPPPHP